MESEERRRREKKEREKQMALEEMERNRSKKLGLRSEAQQMKTEVSELLKKNALKEMTKEENYKNVPRIRWPSPRARKVL